VEKRRNYAGGCRENNILEKDSSSPKKEFTSATDRRNEPNAREKKKERESPRDGGGSTLD